MLRYFCIFFRGLWYCVYWSYKILNLSKLHKTVDRFEIKSVMLMKCNIGYICSSKVLFWCVWCAGVFGVLVCLVCWWVWWVGASGLLVSLMCWWVWCAGASGVLMSLVCWWVWCACVSGVLVGSKSFKFNKNKIKEGKKGERILRKIHLQIWRIYGIINMGGTGQFGIIRKAITKALWLTFRRIDVWH